MFPGLIIGLNDLFIKNVMQSQDNLQKLFCFFYDVVVYECNIKYIAFLYVVSY